MNKNEMTCYRTDASRLEGNAVKVLFPESAEEVKNVVKGASSDLDIVPRGGGSNLVGGCVPRKLGSIIVDMRKMNKVLDFNPKDKTVFAEAGVTIKELNEKLKAVGFEFPDFFNEFSTIGGLTALNSISDFSRYGHIKEWIEEIEFVNGRGDFIKVSKADLGDVCGMEGITGIITKIKLRVISILNKSASVFQTDNIEEAILIARRLRLENEVIMLKLYNPHVSKFLGFPQKYNVIIVFNSGRGKIKEKDFYELLKTIKKDRYLIYSNKFYNTEDPKFFFERLLEFVQYLEEERILYILDLIKGVVFPMFEDGDSMQKEVVDVIQKMNGKRSKYGIGLKRHYLLDSLEKKIIYRVKLRHDPFNKLNKGKFLDLDNFKKESREFSGKNEAVSITEASNVLDVEDIPEVKLRVENVVKADFGRKDEKELYGVSPEEKMRNFIKEIEKKELTEEEKEAGKKLIDYAQTFKSEILEGYSKENFEKIEKSKFSKKNFDAISFGNVNDSKFSKEIEVFTNNVPREIIKSEPEEEVISDIDLEIGSVKIDDNFGVESRNFREKISDSEKNLIDNIMTNKFGIGGEKKKDKEDDKKKDEKKGVFERWE